MQGVHEEQLEWYNKFIAYDSNTCMHVSLLLKFSAHILFLELFGSAAEQQHFLRITDQVSFKLQMQIFWFIELSHKFITKFL